MLRQTSILPSEHKSRAVRQVLLPLYLTEFLQQDFMEGILYKYICQVEESIKTHLTAC